MCACVRACVRMYVCECQCVRLCVFMCAPVCMCVRESVRASVSACARARACVCVCVRACVHACVYVFGTDFRTLLDKECLWLTEAICETFQGKAESFTERKGNSHFVTERTLCQTSFICNS